MRQRILATKLGRNLGVNRDQSNELIKKILSVMTDRLREKRELILPRLGRFRLFDRRAMEVNNFGKGDSFKLGKSVLIKFRADKKLNRAINQSEPESPKKPIKIRLEKSDQGQDEANIDPGLFSRQPAKNYHRPRHQKDFSTGRIALRTNLIGRSLRSIFHQADLYQAGGLKIGLFRDQAAISFETAQGEIFSTELPVVFGRKIISEIKELARLSDGLTEGSFELSLGPKRELLAQVRALSVVGGLSLKIDLFDPKFLDPSLQDFFFDQDQLELVLEAISKPEFSIVLVGPRKSGLSSLYYSLISTLNQRKIISIESQPIGLFKNFFQVRAGNELNYQGLKRLIDQATKQQPELLGLHDLAEIRLANQVVNLPYRGVNSLWAMPGSSALSALKRIISSEQPEPILDQLKMIVASRLVKSLCQECLSLDKRFSSRLRDRASEGYFKSSGCPHCGQIGQTGSLPLCEVLPVERALVNRLKQAAPARDVIETARASGFQPLVETGLKMVRAGQTSLESLEAAL